MGIRRYSLLFISFDEATKHTGEFHREYVLRRWTGTDILKGFEVLQSHCLVVYGLGCGAMTIFLRVWSNYSDGVVFACLLMNLCVPLFYKIKAKQKIPAVRSIG